MSHQNIDHADDDDFDAFLQKKGDLAQMLQQLPQPTPPVTLSEAILFDAESALKQHSPANESFIPDPTLGPAPRHFLRRARWPLALAASVLVAVIAGLQWQDRSSEFDVPMIAQAQLPTAAPSQRSDASAEPVVPIAPMPAPSDARRSASVGDSVRKQGPAITVAPPTVIAQADIPETAPDSTMTRSGPSYTGAERESAAAAPAPASVSASEIAPVAASPAPATGLADNAKAKAWLSLIDEMIKAELNRDALEEWEKFHKAYPHYPVPEKLSAKIKTLKK